MERNFPLLAVENGCIVSKQGEITVAFKVDLAEIFTKDHDDFEALHAVWCKAIRLLPHYTIVAKQDWFTADNYEPNLKGDANYLTRSFELNFSERPFLSHECYLFVTKTTKERSRGKSINNSLCHSYILHKSLPDQDIIDAFMDAVGQFESILNDSGHLKLHRLNENDIIGEPGTGIIDKYFSLSGKTNRTLKDVRIDPGSMRVGDNILSLHTLTDVDDLPEVVYTDSRFEKLSTDRSDCRLSFASPVGLLLSCNHIYNQVIFIDDHEQTLKMFEKRARNMNSLSNYSRANSVNREWIDLYLDEAHTSNKLSVRSYFGVLAWSDDPVKLKKIKNDVGSQLAAMGCTPRHNTVDLPTHFWAGIPGNAGDYPYEDSFYTFLEQGACFFTGETNYRSSPSPFGIKMVDRITGIPLHLDISDLPMKMGLTTNRNKVIFGPSGSGKSFFTNHLSRQYYDQGSHILIVDRGNSYRGLCDFINRRTKGKDGIYMTYTEENPISFNPFYSDQRIYSINKRETIVALLMTLWKREDEPPTRAEEVNLANAVNMYLNYLQNDRSVHPCFNTFYEFLSNDFRIVLKRKKVRQKDFDIETLINVLEPYYKGGQYDYLLNNMSETDLINKRFIVFELDEIGEHSILLPVVTLVIMETFIEKLHTLKGVRKMILIEECWKAITSAGMSEFIRYLYKTVRKHFGEAVIVTQEVDDIVDSPIVKETIINNADCKILLDQRKYMNKFDAIQSLLGITDKQKSQIMSINQANDPNRIYKEVWIGLGGTHSAVYATEVSPQEYCMYTTEQNEKMEVQNAIEKHDGDIERALREITTNKTKNNE
ncbi:MAG: TraG family conjugative transposon ATPase [Alistipes sp.]|nr:TraG family conjugative transposon ATPase [Alistipes sp.]